MVDGVEVDDAVVAFVDEEDSPDLDCFGVSVCSLCVNKVSDLKISFTLMGLVEVDLELPLSGADFCCVHQILHEAWIQSLQRDDLKLLCKAQT